MCCPTPFRHINTQPTLTGMVCSGLWNGLSEEGSLKPGLWNGLSKEGSLKPGLWNGLSKEGSLKPGLWNGLPKEGNLKPGLWNGLSKEGSLKPGLWNGLSKEGSLKPGLWNGLSKEESLKPGLAFREWGRLALWKQAVISRQMEQRNWNSADRKILNYIQECYECKMTAFAYCHFDSTLPLTLQLYSAQINKIMQPRIT